MLGYILLLPCHQTKPQLLVAATINGGKSTDEAGRHYPIELIYPHEKQDYFK